MTVVIGVFMKVSFVITAIMKVVELCDYGYHEGLSIFPDISCDLRYAIRKVMDSREIFYCSTGILVIAGAFCDFQKLCSDHINYICE